MMPDDDDKLPPLSSGQKVKHWAIGGAGAVAILAAKFPVTTGRWLHMRSDRVQVGGLMLLAVFVAAFLFVLRCLRCGLNIGKESFGNHPRGWLQSVKRCPRCGSDHAGRVAPRNRMD